MDMFENSCNNGCVDVKICVSNFKQSTDQTQPLQLYCFTIMFILF